MNNKMSLKKVILYLLFFIIIALLTFYSILKESNINEIIENIKKINPIYSLICLLLMSLYFIFQGLYNKIACKSLNTEISLKKGIFYSMVEFFFSGITPSSTGGQPMELAYMSKDNIPMRKSIIVLVLNTIYFKLFMIFFGIIIMIFNSSLIFSDKLIFTFLFFIGFIGDLLLILICYFLIFRPSFIKKIVNFYIKLKKKFKKSEVKISADAIVEKYQDEVDYVMTHKKDAIHGILVTFIQRICFFSITFVIYKAFNLSGYSFIQLFFMQIAVHMCTEFIPLPGGTGVSEHLFNNLFIDVFGNTLATVGMTLTRIFTYYFPIFVCLMLIIATNARYIKGEKYEK